MGAEYIFVLVCFKCGRGVYICSRLFQVWARSIYLFSSVSSVGAEYIFVLVCFKCGRGVYICSRLFQVWARSIYLFPSVSNTCACGTFRYFPLFTLFLEEFDYTARVQHALVAVERK